MATPEQSHIGVISPEFPPDIGGVENYAAGYAAALARLGYRVTVFTRPHPQGEVEIPGVEIRPVLRLKRMLDRKILSEPGIDAWHPMNAAYSFIAEETDKPVVVSVHGNDFLRAYYPVTAPAFEKIGPLWRFAEALRKADPYFMGHTTREIAKWLPKASAVLTNSRYTESVLLQKIPACRGKTIASLVGIDPFFLSAAPTTSKENERPILLTVTRLSEPRKNVDLVLRALARLKEYEYRYKIIGEGELRPRLENLAASLGIADRVEFLGSVGQEQLQSELGGADLFVLTSSILRTSHEGFGIVYLEAAASGTPSLGARVAGAAEAIGEGESGYFVDVPTEENIARALKVFFRKEIDIPPASCRAFAQRFTWDRVVEQAVPFYRAVPTLTDSTP